MILRIIPNLGKTLALFGSGSGRLLVKPTIEYGLDRASRASLHVRHNKRTDRAVITAAPKAHMAAVVLTRLHLLTPEQIASWHVEPAGNRLHQLIAGNREAIHITAAG
jgi:hypothetical protein